MKMTQMQEHEEPGQGREQLQYRQGREERGGVDNDDCP
jgi:hypothetical protein